MTKKTTLLLLLLLLSFLVIMMIMMMKQPDGIDFANYEEDNTVVVVAPIVAFVINDDE